MLFGIGQQISKQIKNGRSTALNTHFLESCKEAITCMHELNTYINRFKKDSDYKDSVRKLTDRIRNMKSTAGLESDFGQLMFEGPMEFKMQNQTKYNDKCYLMCFQLRILIFDIENQEDDPSALKDVYFYVESIEVSNKMNLTVAKVRRDWVITVQTHENFVINNRKSFNIKVELEQEMKELEKKFKNLLDKAAPRLCDKHRLHDFHTCLQQHDIDIRNPKAPPSCGECGLYLFGQIFMGYKCENCNCYYHEYCFIEGYPDPNLGKLHL